MYLVLCKEDKDKKNDFNRRNMSHNKDGYKY